MLYDNDEFIFIGFDCAYRSLGWSILGYNPHAPLLRDIYCFHAGGVVDVIGKLIATVTVQERASALARVLDQITSMVCIARTIIVIEEQPHNGKKSANNYAIESQIIYHYTRVAVARSIHTIHALRKNVMSRAILHEPVARNYRERKNQARRALVHMIALFNFDALHRDRRDYAHIRADLADSCMQIIALIAFYAQDIDNDNRRC
jgi:hypothetical protein